MDILTFVRKGLRLEFQNPVVALELEFLGNTPWKN